MVTPHISCRECSRWQSTTRIATNKETGGQGRLSHTNRRALHQAPAWDIFSGAKLRWFLFDVYVAGLYLPPDVEPSRVLDDVPKRIEFHYLVSIDGKDFGPAGEKILRRGLSEEALAPLADRLARIRAAYRDVEPGDRYALTYVPGRGTELSMNGQPILTIEGADFARAYFSIWLGEKPLDDGFRKNLLRGLPIALSLR